jgi:hypothetical protein
VDIQFSQYHLLKMLPFFQCMILAPLPIIRCQNLLGLISECSVLFHWSMCQFLWQYHAVFVTVACSTFWSQGLWHFQNCFLLRIAFGSLGSLCSYMNFRIAFSISLKFWWGLH